MHAEKTVCVGSFTFFSQSCFLRHIWQQVQDFSGVEKEHNSFRPTFLSFHSGQISRNNEALEHSLSRIRAFCALYNNCILIKHQHTPTYAQQYTFSNSFMAYRNPLAPPQCTDMFLNGCSCQGNQETRQLPPNPSTVHHTELERDTETRHEETWRTRLSIASLPLLLNYFFLSDWVLGGICPWCLPEWNCNVFQVSHWVSLG